MNKQQKLQLVREAKQTVVNGSLSAALCIVLAACTLWYSFYEANWAVVGLISILFAIIFAVWTAIATYDNLASVEAIFEKEGK